MIIRIAEGDFVRTYSDRGVYIHGGYPEGDYAEAIDPIGIERTYTETDVVIQSEPLSAQEALDTIFGGTDDTVHTEPSA